MVIFVGAALIHRDLVRIAAYSRKAKSKHEDESLNTLIPLLGKLHGPLHILLIWFAATNGRATDGMLEEALSVSLQADDADLAVRAAVEAGCWPVVRSALIHPRAAARKRAMEPDRRTSVSLSPVK